MVTTTYLEEDRPVTGSGPCANAGHSESGVSWGAIFAGALAAAVLSLLLFMLGIGLGLSSVSVWSGRGADGETIGWGAVAWLVFTQLASAGVGGYIAGRLRTRWQGLHTDEVYFRDTAHGFLAWSLATMLMVGVAGSIAGAAISSTAKVTGAVVSGAAQVVGGAASGASSVIGGAASAAISGATMGKASESGSDINYWINTLLRQGGPAEQQKQEIKDGAQNAVQKARYAAVDASEMTSVFAHSLKIGSLSDDDRQYVGRLVAQRTDMSQEAAEKKVQSTYDQVNQQIDMAKQAAQDAEVKTKQAAEQARKASAYSLIWIFVVLLIGAFVGSLSATFGGRQRDA